MRTDESGSPVSRRCRRLYEDVVRQAERLEAMAAEPDERLRFRAQRVSAWSVADHLMHLALSNRGMSGAICRALDLDDATAQGRPTARGRGVLLSGWIPRGVGKAPEFTRPDAAAGAELRDELAESRRAVKGLGAILSAIEVGRGRVNHFAFGDLTPRQWLKLMGIHTRHHLKIIRDIQMSQGSPW